MAIPTTNGLGLRTNRGVHRCFCGGFGGTGRLSLGRDLITADDLLRWSIGLAQSNWRRRLLLSHLLLSHLLLSRLLLGWLLFGRLLFGGHYYRGSVCIRTRGSGAARRATAHPLPGLWIFVCHQPC